MLDRVTRWLVAPTLGLAAALGLILAAPAGAATYTVPATIDGTGTTDVTAQLLAFFESVPDGSTIVFPAGRTYRVDGVLRIELRNDLVFDGRGSRIVAKSAGDRNRRHWWFWGGSKITVRNLTVVGANPVAGTAKEAYDTKKEAQHGFDVAGVQGFHLENVEVSDVWGDFVYIGKGPGGFSRDVTVRRSRFARNGRQGISITAGERVLIEHNDIRDVRHTVFDIEPNGPEWGARHVVFRRNTIGAGRLTFVSGHGYKAPVIDIEISDNRLVGKAMNMSFKSPSGSRRSGLRITGNVSDVEYGSPAPLIVVDGFDDVVVRGNSSPLDPRRGMTAVLARNSCGVEVAGNDFPGALRTYQSETPSCSATPSTTRPAVRPAAPTSRTPRSTAAPTSSAPPKPTAPATTAPPTTGGRAPEVAAPTTQAAAPPAGAAARASEPEDDDGIPLGLAAAAVLLAGGVTFAALGLVGRENAAADDTEG